MILLNRWRLVCLVGLSLSFLALGGERSVRGADAKASAKKPASKKSAKSKPAADLPPITLPNEPTEIVLSYDPGVGASDPERKGPAPWIKIQGDGAVIVTSPADGTQKTGRLTEKEMKELLAFVVHEHDFVNLTAAQIDEEVNKLAAKSGSFTDVRGIGTSVIAVKLADKQHEVSYRAALMYYKKHPKAEVVGRFAEIEKRLAALAVKVSKGKKS